MAERGELVRVQTGPSSFLKMTVKQAVEYRNTVGEHGRSPAATVELTAQAGETAPVKDWTVARLRQFGEETGLELPKDALKAQLVALVEAELERRSQLEAPELESAGGESSGTAE